jgi:hypothetical protein
MAIEAFEFHEVETCRRPPDLREIECSDHLLRRENFLVAMCPAEPHKVVPHCGRQITHGPVGIDAERAVPFRQL